LPIVHLGKRREALFGKAELYKKKVVEYLETRGYYPQMDSFVEGTLADCILSRKARDREYWLEAKATTISLYDAKFASELGKYLAAYLTRSPENRFKMLLAVYDYRRRDVFEAIYNELDEVAINDLITFIVKVADTNVKKVIRKADDKIIRQFFEDTEVYRATLQGFEEAIEEILPRPPVKPRLTDVKYAAEVLNRYRTNYPLEKKDVLLSNLFTVKLPDSMYIAPTSFASKMEIFKRHPEVIFPNFRLVGKKIYSFHPFSAESHLGKMFNVPAVRKVGLKEWDTTNDTTNIVLFLVYRRINNLCRKKALSYDDRTESYFFSDYPPRKYPKFVSWKKEGRTSSRRVIAPVRREGTLYYYQHRAVRIAVRRLWGDYFIHLTPRWIFSGDCYTPYPGELSDKLDRAYRKSKFTQNRNKLNDVLFWAWYLFAEGSMPLERYLRPDGTRDDSLMFHPINQISVVSNVKPNISEREEADEEETEEIDTLRILDVFFEED